MTSKIICVLRVDATVTCVHEGKNICVLRVDATVTCVHEGKNIVFFL